MVGPGVGLGVGPADGMGVAIFNSECEGVGPSVGEAEGAGVVMVGPGVGLGVGPADGMGVGDGVQTSQQPSGFFRSHWICPIVMSSVTYLSGQQL